MPRFKLTIAYDGSGFHGWQAQTQPADHGRRTLRTVQDTVRDALARALGQPITVVGASRTDTGVHALGQVAHFDAETRIPRRRLAMAINSRLPRDVEIRRAEPAAEDFDAIRDALCKQYRYRIWTASRRPLQHRHYTTHCWRPLDHAAMSEAAERLVGEHDFAGFANAGHGRQSTVRTIHHCRVERAWTPTPELHVLVSADGFLYNMVRILVGTLIEVGRGAAKPQVVDSILTTGDRTQAGPTAPPQGLCLEWIRHRDVPAGDGD